MEEKKIVNIKSSELVQNCSISKIYESNHFYDSPVFCSPQLAAKALPAYEIFLAYMLIEETSEVTNEGALTVTEDMEMCATAMGVIITLLQQYYTQANIEIEEVV